MAGREEKTPNEDRMISIFKQFRAASLMAAMSLAGAFGLHAQIDVTEPGDPIVPSSMNFPATENPANAIDNTAATKYLNFDKLNTGFTVTPSHGPRSVVTSVALTSANDAPERD